MISIVAEAEPRLPIEAAVRREGSTEEARVLGEGDNTEELAG